MNKVNKKNKLPIVTKPLVALVIIYASIITIQKLLELIFRNQNSDNYQLLVFILTTLLITLIILSLRKSLNLKYANTYKVVNTAVIIWSLKIGFNITNQVINLVENIDFNLYQNLSKIIYNGSLILNISLLTCAIIFIIINKLENVRLWLLLAIVQVSNFIYNLVLVPTIFSNEILTNLIVNFILLVLKLLIVVIIVIIYSKKKVPEGTFIFELIL